MKIIGMIFLALLGTASFTLASGKGTPEEAVKKERALIVNIRDMIKVIADGDNVERTDVDGDITFTAQLDPYKGVSVSFIENKYVGTLVDQATETVTRFDDPLYTPFVYDDLRRIYKKHGKKKHK